MADKETLVAISSLGILRGQKPAPQNDKGLKVFSKDNASWLSVAFRTYHIQGRMRGP